MINLSRYKLLINPIRHSKNKTYLVNLSNAVFFKTGNLTGKLIIVGK